MSNLKRAVLNMASVNMGARKSDRILVLTDDFDKKRTRLAEEVNEILSSKYNTNFHIYKNTGQNGKEPDKETAKLLFKYDIIFMINSFSLTHTQARENASKKGVRIASMPSFERSMFATAMSADYNKVGKRGERLLKFTGKRGQILVESENGTMLYVEYPIAFVDDFGKYVKRGDCGNLPSGEIFVAPSYVSGTLVIDKGWFYEEEWGKKNDSPITFTIRNTEITEINGSKLAPRLRKLFFAKKHRKRVAELGIGLNDKARNPLNTLEAEKILGTIHMAFGNNIHFGGKNDSDVHYDFILSKPSLFVNGKKIINKGKYLF